MEATTVARRYYRTIDDGAYDDLAALLAPEFVHERPDRTLDGRETFVSFMREDRPRTDTEHEVEGVYEGPDGVAVTGRLLGDGDGELFRFVDVFEVRDERIEGLRTYTAVG
ncbi:MAG: nuclear transport factor 2 family protein [Halanaeroarchaeum sp.]